MDTEYYGKEIFDEIIDKIKLFVKSHTNCDILDINSFSNSPINGFVFFYDFSLRTKLFTEIKNYISSKNTNEYIVSILYYHYSKNLIQEDIINAPYKLVFMTNFSNIYEVKLINRKCKTDQQIDFINRENLFKNSYGNVTNNYCLVLNILKKYDILLDEENIYFLKSLSLCQTSNFYNQPESTNHTIKTLFNNTIYINRLIDSCTPSTTYFDYIISIYNKVAVDYQKEKKYLDKTASEFGKTVAEFNKTLSDKKILKLNDEIISKNKEIDCLKYENNNLELENTEIKGEYEDLKYSNNTLMSEIATLKETLTTLTQANDSLNYSLKEINELNHKYWYIPKPFQ
jgi:FtsZ-binding cell division protein ZapB